MIIMDNIKLSLPKSLAPAMSKLHQIKHYILHALKASHGGHGVHSPFVYSLCEEVFYNDAKLYLFPYLSLKREQLLKDSTWITMEEHGAGSLKFTSSQRRVSEITKYGISQEKQSEMLSKLISYLKIETCLELGTSVGLNALYLASSGAQVHTIEGCKGLYEFAKTLNQQPHFEKLHHHYGLFDDVFPQLLAQSKSPLFVYIDGNHTYEATLKYVNWCMQHANAYTVIALDDIYWNAQMTNAWNKVREMEQVTISIDLYTTGLLFFRNEPREKIHYYLRY